MKSQFNRRDVLKLTSAAVLAQTLQGCGGGSYSDIEIPMPNMLRNDLNFVYFLSIPGQTIKVQDHTNLIWHGQFYDNARLEIEAQSNNFDIILDCAIQLFSRGFPATVSSTAKEDLHNYFTDLNNRGLLARIKYLICMDEPNLFAKSEYEVRKAMAILKEEAKIWECLRTVKYMCIYGGKGGYYPALDEFDIVGIDNYDQKSEILTIGAHADLMRNILPNQKVMVIPGAAYGQNPNSFVAYAHSEPRCWGVVPFIWAHVSESADKEGWVGLEKQSEEKQNIYREAGKLTLNR